MAEAEQDANIARYKHDAWTAMPDHTLRCSLRLQSQKSLRKLMQELREPDPSDPKDNVTRSLRRAIPRETQEAQRKIPSPTLTFPNLAGAAQEPALEEEATDHSSIVADAHKVVSRAPQKTCISEATRELCFWACWQCCNSGWGQRASDAVQLEKNRSRTTYTKALNQYRTLNVADSNQTRPNEPSSVPGRSAHACTCIHMYTHVCKCIQMYPHVYTCIQVYSHVYECIHMYTHVYTCIHMYTHVYACIHMYTHVYTCIHMYTHVYTCIHMYTHV